MSRMEQILPASRYSLTVKSLACMVAGCLNIAALAADDAPATKAKPNWAAPLQAPKISPVPQTNDRPGGLLKSADPFAKAPLQKTEVVKKQVLQKPVPIEVNGKTTSTAPKSLHPASKFSQGAGPAEHPQPGLLAEPLPLTRLGQVDLRKSPRPAGRNDSFIKPVSGTELEENESLELATPQATPLGEQNSPPFPSDPVPRMTPPESSVFSSSPIESKPQPVPAFESQPIAPLQPSPTPQLSQPAPFAPSAVPQQPVSSPSAPEFQPRSNAFPPTQQQQTTYNPPTAEPKLLTPSPQQAVEDEIHEVQPGENYWTISRQHFGTARYFAALSEYNKHRIPRPDRMKPGMFVLVPETKVLEQRYPQMAGIVDSKPSPESLLPTGFFIGPNGQPLFRIGKGDTLTDIAEKHLGRTARWTQVAGMNRDLLKDGNNLKIGMVLRLPHDASQVALAPSAGVLR